MVESELKTTMKELATLVETIGQKPGSYDVAVNNLRYVRRELIRIIGGRISITALDEIQRDLPQKLEDLSNCHGCCTCLNRSK